MKRILALSLAGFCFLPLVARASICRPASPAEYLVFSRGDLQYESSDFQGLTGAGSKVTMKDFNIHRSPPASGCPSLIAGSDVSLVDGSIQGGGVHSGGHIRLRRVSVQGELKALGGVSSIDSNTTGSLKAQSSSVESLVSTSRFFVNQSRRFSEMPAKAYSSSSNNINFEAEPSGMSVFQISAERLAQNSIIRLRGSALSWIVINVLGSNASIRAQDIRLEGGIGFGRVLFNFVNATDLDITASGEIHYGIPATILAPLAATQFWNGLISGGLYIGSLCGNGQVNPGVFSGWLTEANVDAPVPALRCQYCK